MKCREGPSDSLKGEARAYHRIIPDVEIIIEVDELMIDHLAVNHKGANNQGYNNPQVNQPDVDRGLDWPSDLALAQLTMLTANNCVTASFHFVVSANIAFKK